MRINVRLAVPLLLCVFASLVAVAQTTDVDWVRGTDFSRFHTFTWATGAYPIVDPDASLGMALAVQSQLEQKGVKYVDPQQRFDLFVTYNAQINPDVQDSSRKTVTLQVRIFDSRNNTVIWRSGGFLPLTNDKQQNRSKLRELLARMFDKYPPSE